MRHWQENKSALVSRCCQYFASARHLSLSANPAIIQTKNDCISQGIDIQLKILQTLLSFITNFPAILDRLLKNVRTFVLFPSSLTDGPALAVTPSAFQAA